MCNRFFCYFCLKGNYDTLAENIKDNNTWLCPYCTGACYCTRCMRNEKILQLIAYYFSIDGNIIDLSEKLTLTNSIMDELFPYSVLNNTYLILYDKNLTPAQMINNFINFDKEKYNERKNKENEIFNFKKYIQQLNKQKEEIHNTFISFCKDKFEVKNKYFSKNLNQNGNNSANKEINDNINNGIVNNDKDSKSDDNIINDVLNRNKGNNVESGYVSKIKKNRIYISGKYNSKKKIKKAIRKNKSVVLRNTGKYYLDKK